MSPTRPRRLHRYIVSALLTALCGCYPNTERIDGVTLGGTFDTWENEPNDDAMNPDPLGPIAVGEGEIIGGYITDVAGSDVLDGFAFQTVEPCSIEFTLIATSEFTDLDLCVYDPQMRAYSFCFQGSGHIEKGAFPLPFAGTDFHLVVSSFHGSSEYRLNLRCVPLGFSPLASPPASPDKPGRAGELARYFAQRSEPVVDEARVVARGVWLELEPASGVVREAPLAVLAGGN